MHNHTDPRTDPRTDPSPRFQTRYNERCCPWTQRGSTTVGFPCHDLPEGATCSEANQCGSFPKQRPNDGDGDSNGFDGTDDLLVPGLFCGDSPMAQDTGRHDSNIYAQYDPKDPNVQQGSDPTNTPHHDRQHIITLYNQTTPGDWDPSNLVQKCTKVLLPGEPCCDADGSNCHDWCAPCPLTTPCAFLYD